MFSQPENIDTHLAPRSARVPLKVGALTTWLENPKYARTRDRLIEYLRSDKYRFRRLEPVLFLCGGAGSARREALRDYLHKHKPWIGTFYAERVWDLLASQTELSALEMERDLAALADLVLVIVESPGTFTELGAFSLSDQLRKKLLPIVDIKFKDSSSFISTGPLRWIDDESEFAPTVYVPLARILEAIDEIEERIKRIERTRAVKISDLASSPKHLLFFLCDLIAVIHPATIKMVEYYLERIAPSVLGSSIKVPTLLGLAVAMDLLHAKVVIVDEEEETFFWPSKATAIARPFHHRSSLDLPSQRAAQAAVLLTVPEAIKVLQELRNIR